MKDFMLLVRTAGDHLEALSPEEKQQHVEKISRYIENLMKQDKLKAAEPLAMDGIMVSGEKGTFKDGPFNETKEVIVGYFLISAEDLDEAVQIAKSNPLFEDGAGRIEVRPIKTMEGIN